jgi:hypothetical protein
MQFETTDEILTEIKQRMEEAGESTMPQFENTYKSICEALKRLDGGTVE